MSHPVRTYRVADTSTLFGTLPPIDFPSARPAGEVVRIRAYGRSVDVLLTDTPLAGGRFAAWLHGVAYL